MERVGDASPAWTSSAGSDAQRDVAKSHAPLNADTAARMTDELGESAAFNTGAELGDGLRAYRKTAKIGAHPTQDVAF